MTSESNPDSNSEDNEGGGGNTREGTTLEVWLAGENRQLEVAADETIFAAALRAGLDLPFSCLGGYCGACMATLETGDVEMRVNQHLSDKQLARGLILTCQAVPTGPGCRIRFVGE